MQRRLIAVLVAVVLAGVACGGSGGEAVVSTPAGARAAVRAAAKRSSDAPTQKVRMTVTLDGDELTSFTARTSKDGRVGEGEVPIGAGRSIAYRMVGSNIYYAFPNLPPGVEWVSLGFDDLAAQGMDMDALRGNAGKDALGLIAEVGKDVRKVGTDRIDGVTATRYRYSVDLAKAAAKTRMISGALLDDATDLFGTTLELDVWIDADGLVRRVAYKTDLADAPSPPKGLPSKGTIGFRFDISDYGEPLDRQAPDPATVITMAEYRQSLTGGD